MTKDNTSQLCEIKCMVFNEVACEVASLIRKEIGKKPKKGTVGINEYTFQFALFPVGEPPICEGGWSLV